MFRGFIIMTGYTFTESKNEAATCIQKIWRGYQTRFLDRRVSDVYQQIQSMRFNQYIK